MITVGALLLCLVYSHDSQGASDTEAKAKPAPKAPKPLVGNDPSVVDGVKYTSMISKEKAIEVAMEWVNQNKLKFDKEAGPQVEAHYQVIVLPEKRGPNIMGGDYVAKLTVNAYTGKITKTLVAP